MKYQAQQRQLRRQGWVHWAHMWETMAATENRVRLGVVLRTVRAWMAVPKKNKKRAVRHLCMELNASEVFLPDRAIVLDGE
jgi:hypothetical protein